MPRVSFRHGLLRLCFLARLAAGALLATGAATLEHGLAEYALNLLGWCAGEFVLIPAAYFWYSAAGFQMFFKRK